MLRLLLVALAATIAVLLPKTSLAFNWTEEGVVFDINDIPYATTGPGSPAVEVDKKDNNRLLMAFEYKSSNTHPNCGTTGIWGIGLAESFDGLNWSAIDGDNNGGNGISPLIEPNPSVGGTSHDCVMAHPSLLWTSAASNKEMWLYYKAQDDSNANFTGVGVMKVVFNGNGTIQSKTDYGVVLPITVTFGYSNVMQHPDGSYYMLVQKKLSGVNKYALYEATASSENGTWTLGGSPVMSPPTYNYSWAINEFFSPELFCHDVDPGDNYDEIHAWIGGRTFGAGGTVTSGGMAEAVLIEDGLSGYDIQDPPERSWANSTDYRHFAIAELEDSSGNQDFVMYWVQLSGGNRQIHYAHTRASSTISDFTEVDDNRCL